MPASLRSPAFRNRVLCCADAMLAVLASVGTAQSTGTLQRDAAHWHNQRAVALAAAAPTAAQCVVLDAELYAHAAPGLRDVRLLQDGHELPFAIDESHDDAGEASQTGRAVFDTVAQAAQPSAAAAQGLALLLQAHVPVERIALVLSGASQEPTRVHLEAQPQEAGQEAEVVDWTLQRGETVAMVTLGANLQHDARVTVTAAPAVPRAVALQMRRRELCFQPLSAAPLVLLLGNAGALPVHYDFAAHFQPAAEPLLARLGPIQPNPRFRAAPVLRPLRPTWRRWLTLAIAACASLLLLTLLPLLRAHRR